MLVIVTVAFSRFLQGKKSEGSCSLRFMFKTAVQRDFVEDHRSLGRTEWQRGGRGLGAEASQGCGAAEISLSRSSCARRLGANRQVPRTQWARRLFCSSSAGGAEIACWYPRNVGCLES